jgi:hypothetical protein
MKIAPCALTTVIATAIAGLAWAGTPPQAPAEIAAAVPAGMTLLSFKASGTQAGATAAAVYETAPDGDGVRHRQLTLFGNANGKFIPEVTSNKLIACSRCSQYHDDQFYPNHVEVSAGHVHIDQFDSGEMPSTTTFDFVQKQGKWYVTKATRDMYEAGGGDPHREKLPVPVSSLVQDMDGRWSVPTYFNALVVNDTTGRYSFPHGIHTMKELQDDIATSFTCKSAAGCRVLLQTQQDGCMSLVRDGTGRSFGATNTDPESKVGALDKAIAACKSGGSSTCKEVETRCNKGIRAIL